MVVINMEIPKGCQHCKFFRKHTFGNGLDYSYSCDIGGTNFPMPWIRQMEERAKDCPLVEIEERKVGKWIRVGSGSLIDDFRCDCCNKQPALKKVGYTWGWDFTDYCPNCGAEMKGAENE